MGTGQVYKNVKVFIGGYDISGNMNQFAAPYEFEKVSFQSAGRPCGWVKPGMPSLSYSLQGHAESDDDPLGVEDVLSVLQAVEDVPIMWCPKTGAAGEVAFFAKGVGFEYLAAGQVGQGYSYSAAGGGQTRVVRGTVLEYGSKAASGDGTPRLVSAVTATQRLYGVLHVLAVTGTDPTLDVVIESDEASAFESAVERLTFSQAGAIGAQFASVAGPITDTYFRAAVTVGGTDDPAFLIALAVGVL